MLARKKAIVAIGLAYAALFAACSERASEPPASGGGGISGAGGTGGTSGSQSSGGASASGGRGGSGSDSGGGGGDTSVAGSGGMASIDGGAPLVPDARRCVEVPSGEPLARDPNYQASGPSDTATGIGRGVALDSRGRLVAVGTDSLVSGARVVRFLENGEVDSSFGSFGAARFPPPAASHMGVTSLAIDADDGIWVGGIVERRDEALGELQSWVAHALESGAPDPLWAEDPERPGQRVFTARDTMRDPPVSVNIKRIAPTETGALIAGDGYLDHLRADGSFHRSFTQQALETFSFTAFAYAGGVIYVGGSKLWSYSNGGPLRTEFGEQGVFALEGDLAVRDLLVLADGRVLLHTVESDGARLLRITADGVLDTSYGDAGRSEAFVDTCVPQDIVALCNGRIALAGLSRIPGQPGVARYCATLYDPNGSLDEAMPAEGFVTWDIPEDRDSRPDVMFDAQGRIVAFNMSRDSSLNYLDRFNPPWSQP